MSVYGQGFEAPRFIFYGSSQGALMGYELDNILIEL